MVSLKDSGRCGVKHFRKLLLIFPSWLRRCSFAKLFQLNSLLSFLRVLTVRSGVHSGILDTNYFEQSGLGLSFPEGL